MESSFAPLFHKYLPSAFDVPDSVLGAETTQSLPGGVDLSGRERQQSE